MHCSSVHQNTLSNVPFVVAGERGEAVCCWHVFSKGLTSSCFAYSWLQESEERWLYALSGSNDGVWDWNVLDNTMFFSDRWKQMLG